VRRPIFTFIATSVTAKASLTAIPLLARTGAGLLEGTAAIGDWHADRPGARRLIELQDSTASDLA